MRFGGATVSKDIEEDLFDIEYSVHECDAGDLVRVQVGSGRVERLKGSALRLESTFLETTTTCCTTVELERDSVIAVTTDVRYKQYLRLQTEYKLKPQVFES